MKLLDFTLLHTTSIDGINTFVDVRDYDGKIQVSLVRWPYELYQECDSIQEAMVAFNQLKLQIGM